MSMFFSLASLALGLTAWVIPAVAIKKANKGCPPKNHAIYSFTACAMAILLQLFEIKNRVALEDFSAIMDTIGAICMVSVFLLFVTVALNIGASVLSKEVESP